MTRPYKPIDLSRVKTYDVEQRQHKTDSARVASLPQAGASAAELLDSFPQYLGAQSFRNVVAAVVAAVRNDRPVVAAFGAHVIKVGCGPILVDLIRRGVLKAVVGNGACAIHDVEMATIGQTSEEVADAIRDGSFGMVRQTMQFFDDAVRRAARESIGLGAAVGQMLLEQRSPLRHQSIFAAAREAGIPACVLVALGTDTVHVSPGLDSAALGQASMLDFRLLCEIVSDLGASGASCEPRASARAVITAGNENPVGGVWLNIGSAVLLPEVFLKAVSVARNLGANLDAMTTANFDMIRHYRPAQNVVTRPVGKGRGFEIIGQHEILLPLLRQAIVEGFQRGS